MKYKWWCKECNNTWVTDDIPDGCPECGNSLVLNITNSPW